MMKWHARVGRVGGADADCCQLVRSAAAASRLLL